MSSEPASPEPILPITIRTLTDDDWPYVAKTASIFSGGDPRVWNTLRARGTKFLLAVSPVHPSVILGFLAYEDFEYPPTLSASVLHLAVTKERYRKQGVFRSLLAHAGFGNHSIILCSHWSEIMREVKRKIPCLTPLTPFYR